MEAGGSQSGGAAEGPVCSVGRSPGAIGDRGAVQAGVGRSAAVGSAGRRRAVHPRHCAEAHSPQSPTPEPHPRTPPHPQPTERPFPRSSLPPPHPNRPTPPVKQAAAGHRRGGAAAARLRLRPARRQGGAPGARLPRCALAGPLAPRLRPRAAGGRSRRCPMKGEASGKMNGLRRRPRHAGRPGPPRGAPALLPPPARAPR